MTPNQSPSPRTPVLVGVGAVMQREEDPARAREPFALMVDALERAAEDSGNRALLSSADRILVPQGFWPYTDPGRLIADKIGATKARTLFAEVGVLQTTLFGEAAREIAAGEANVVLVAGGEAKYRSLRAQILGREEVLTRQPEGTVADTVMKPSAEVVHPLEIERDIPMPITQFAMIESALRHTQRLSIEEHRAALGELWAGFSKVAASNPFAWNGAARSPEEIMTSSEKNRMLAFPYTKLQSSGWNVDQAAGHILCSAAVAETLSIPRDRWIFPLGVVDSNHMLALSERGLIHRSPGFEVAGRCLADRAQMALADIDRFELYSCFPAAVRIQLQELRLSETAATKPMTQTGGMTFAGGPLNNFVLQGMVRMAECLRDSPGTTGLVTAVSGILNKQGVSLWASRSPDTPFFHADVSGEVAKVTPTVKVVGERQGTGTIAGYTVRHHEGVPTTGVALVDFPGGERNLTFTDDQTIVQRMLREEFCARTVHVDEKARFVV